jgi:hypothetical protein
MRADEVVVREVDRDSRHVVVEPLKKPLVSRVNRRMPIRMVRF